MLTRVALGSGALKGSYQYGFFKKLDQLDASKNLIKYDKVYGTSIGSVNAPFIANKKSNNMAPIWEAHDPLHRAMKKDAFNRLIYPLDKSLQCVAAVFARGYWYEKFDKDLIRSLWEAAELTTSLGTPIQTPEIGCVTFNVDKEEEEWIRFIDFDSYFDGIHKSAALPPLFPYLIQNGQWYMDGGITEDVPITKLYDPEFKGIYIIIDNGIDLDRDFKDDVPLVGQYDKMLSVSRRFIRKADKSIQLPPDRTFVFTPKTLYSGDALFSKRKDLSKWIQQGEEDATNFYETLVGSLPLHPTSSI